MTRFLLLFLCLLFAATGCAQTPDAKKDDPKAEAPPEAKADLTDFIKKQYPELDPAGEHNYTKIKNYTDARKRFVYTRAMARLLSFYISSCGHGALIAKQFDAWANTELVNQPTFNLLHAVVCMLYPDGRPNLAGAQELLNKVLRLEPKYEYAHFLKARFQYAALEGGTGSRRELEESLDAAMTQPDFLEAMTLKARFLVTRQPAENASAKALLDKCFECTPDDPATFQDMMGLYAQATSVSALKDKLELHISSGKLSKRYEGEARAFLGYALSSPTEKSYDAAIKSFDAAFALVKPQDDPAAVIRWHIKVAGTWASMAVELRGSKTTVEGQDKKLYDGYVKAARDHVALAAELERTHIPVDMRGPAASAYIEFVGAQIGDFQAVINWLAGYLDSTALRASVRGAFEALLNDMRARINGDEAAAMKNLKDAEAKGESEFIPELARQADNVRQAKFHFKQPESFQYFLKHMSHQNALVAQLVSFILVDSAMVSTKAEDIEAAANAIASRLEQEKEMTTAARAEFQGALIASLLIFDKRNIDLRAIKALRAIVVGTEDLMKTETELISEAREVIQLFNNSDWLKKVWRDEAENHNLRSSRQRRFAELTAWLDEQIAQLEKK